MVDELGKGESGDRWYRKKNQKEERAKEVLVGLHRGTKSWDTHVWNRHQKTKHKLWDFSYYINHWKSPRLTPVWYIHTAYLWSIATDLKIELDVGTTIQISWD